MSARTRAARTLVATLVLLAAAGCVEEPDVRLAEGVDPEGLRQRVEQFAPVSLSFDTTLLDADRKQMLRLLVEASDQLDSIFRRQVWRQNPEFAERLAAATGPGMDAARDYYAVMYGPWDRLQEHEPFLAVGPKPPGAGYYPADMTREAFESWVEAHPDDRDAFTSYYTVIRRTPGGDPEAIPYSEAYHDRLADAARLLREAAALAENASLREFLELRAQSFVSNDYHDSEVAWVELEGNLVEPTIGPYEVYEDQLMGYKAAFESFITLKDPEESARLAQLVSHLPELERALPIPDRHKNLERSFESPVSVATEVYTSGDARAGVQTLAFNLPNDARVREEAGSKKVLLDNVIEAKFREILKPIARVVLDSAQAEGITFEPYFTRILMHELAHGLGPDYVTGSDETVNQALRDRYSAIEEAKADAVGTHSLRVLTERGAYPREALRQVYLGHMVDLVRCVRFGVGEAHGLGCLTQFNVLREKGAILYDEDSRTFSVDMEVMPDAMSELAGTYLTLEVEGDYEGAASFLEQYGRMPPELEEALDRLGDVPVDIRPEFAVEAWMEGW